MTIDDFAAALQTRLDAYYVTLNTPYVTVYPYWPHTPLVLPALVIDDEERTPYTFTLNRLKMKVIVAVELRDEAVVRQELRDYLSEDGAYSVELAIEGDPTLGGVVSDCYVSRAVLEPVMKTQRNRQYYTGMIDIEVFPLT